MPVTRTNTPLQRPSIVPQIDNFDQLVSMIPRNNTLGGGRLNNNTSADEDMSADRGYDASASQLPGVEDMSMMSDRPGDQSMSAETGGNRKPREVWNPKKKRGAVKVLRNLGAVTNSGD